MKLLKLTRFSKQIFSRILLGHLVGGILITPLGAGQSASVPLKKTNHHQKSFELNYFSQFGYETGLYDLEEQKSNASTPYLEYSVEPVIKGFLPIKPENRFSFSLGQTQRFQSYDDNDISASLYFGQKFKTLRSGASYQWAYNKQDYSGSYTDSNDIGTLDTFFFGDIQKIYHRFNLELSAKQLIRWKVSHQFVWLQQLTAKRQDFLNRLRLRGTVYPLDWLGLTFQGGLGTQLSTENLNKYHVLDLTTQATLFLNEQNSFFISLYSGRWDYYQQGANSGSGIYSKLNLNHYPTSYRSISLAHFLTLKDWLEIETGYDWSHYIDNQSSTSDQSHRVYLGLTGTLDLL